MVAATICKYHPGTYGLQEIHLTKDDVSCVNFAWAGWSYQSTHSSYFRRVSVLIHHSLMLWELDLLVDTEARYIFLHCQLYALRYIIAVVYTPPPFSREVLQTLLVHLLDKPDQPLLLIGDFNGYLHPRLDKFPSSTVGNVDRGTILYKFMQEVGWIDLWQANYPHEK